MAPKNAKARPTWTQPRHIPQNRRTILRQPPAAAALSERISGFFASRLSITIILVLLVLAGLPVAVWLDLRNMSERALTEQANELSSTIDSIRNYYASRVVGRVLADGEKTHVLPNYAEVPGAIPIPATLSLELGDLINRNNGNTQFRFFSDYPFKNRPPHAFDDFERQALESLRQNSHSRVYEVSGSIFDRRVRLATPIIMAAACVNCHNTHPDSPKRDWQVGDVRGIEEFTISQPIAAYIFSFKYLLLYFAFVAVTGLAFIGLQRHQSSVIARFNRELARSNEFLSGLAKKIAKYLPPQLYRGIFAGKDVEIATERKKLTVFFSDVVDFTATAERMQPEELTALLNEYLTEMSSIAAAHGGTVNKFMATRSSCSSAIPNRAGRSRTQRRAWRWPWTCSAASPSSTCGGASAASRSPSACAWASTPASATSAISAATTGWTTRSSAPRPISRRVYSRLRSRAGSC